MGKSCRKILRENLVGKSYGKILQENLAGKSCGKILWENLAGNSCGKILQENLAGNATGNLVEKVLMVCNGSKNRKNHQHRHFLALAGNLKKIEICFIFGSPMNIAQY